jgi:hypothetical protein
MIEITTKVKPGTAVQVLGKLSLPYEQRQKRWLRAPGVGRAGSAQVAPW